MEKQNNIYTVKQVNSYVRRMFEDDFILRDIYIRGEISNCTYHRSGHIYFSLKDESGVISAVMFSSYASRLKIRLEEGKKVVVRGSVTVYEAGGRYQLYAKAIEEEGLGDLYRKYEELKARLEEAGFFDSMYKKPVSKFSMNIGVVTSDTGAVIRDIYNVSSRRNPYCQITLYPAQVQGTGAAQSICRGIEVLDKMGFDVIIVGRGGGSIEDLWCFNEESVARAIFNAETPIISAVGHETDFTIADFVSDLRAPTPSAAAELGVFDYYRFIKDLEDYRYSLFAVLNNKLDTEKRRLENYSLKIDKNSPENMLMNKAQHLQELTDKLDRFMIDKLNVCKQKLALNVQNLQGMSPLNRLSAGYSYVSDETGKTLKSIKQVDIGNTIDLYVTDGHISANVTYIEEMNYG